MGYPFVVGRSLAAELGDAALYELARNLHPRDCQACGRSLSGTRPSLVVDDLGAVVSAALYHPRCRASEYNTTGMLSVDGAYLSYDVVSGVMMSILEDRELALPFVMINPSLEQVVLRRNAFGLWTVGTTEHFRQVGLRGIRMAQPVPGARAELAGHTVRVWVGATGEQCWDCPADGVPGLREHIRARHGVAVALTTAHVPTDLFAQGRGGIDQFGKALDSDDVTAGWVALRR